MRAASLVAVLMLAKVLAIGGHRLAMSWWSPPAYFWHDIATGAVFWLIDLIVRRPKVMWTLYAATTAYAALNVPVTRAMASPLTVPMWRAAGGPLLDSITFYLTAANILAMAIVVGAAIIAPFLLRPAWPRARMFVAACAAGFLIFGPLAVPRVETLGLHRNCLSALVMTATPRIAARTEQFDWRASPFETPGGEDVSALHGSAAGANVVLVILESTGAQYLSMYGAPDDPTPHLSALAKDAMVFDNAYAAYPESIKGLFATLCARAPAFDVDAETHARSPCAPLAASLNRAGYRTALFHSGRFTYLGMDAVVAQQRFDTAEDAGAIGGNVHSSFGVDEPATVTRMLSWIDALPRGQRFFIAYLPAAGHHPYVSPDGGPFAPDSELAAYKNALYSGDRALGSLIDGLTSRGLDKNTLYVVIGDHGEAFGQHDGNFGHSIFIFEENVKVPLFVKVPTGTTGTTGTRIRRVASAVDVAPTILDLLGMAAEPLHEGTSLLLPRDRMALFFTDYSLGWLGLRDGCWTSLFEIESRRSKLYDVCKDPGEKTDRAAEFPERVDAYRERLERWARAKRAEVTGVSPPRPDRPR